MTIDPALRSVLERAQARGFLGGDELEPHLRHAAGFVRTLSTEVRAARARPSGDVAGDDDADPSKGATCALDLGSGGGMPGLVLAEAFPAWQWVLLDASEQRTRFLDEAVSELHLATVTVLRGRAEALARDAAWRGRFDIVVSRGFGPPAVVAECAAGFLRVGGHLVVSEPPASGGERWAHPDQLAALGLRFQATVGAEHRFAVLTSFALAGDRVPRRVGVPAKRPLF